jgi:hypothetical protein
MANIAMDWWLLRFENQFLRNKGSGFQSLFTAVMEAAHPDDFTQVRPWGNIGDQKCDGWLNSEKRLFQVYAPNELAKTETEAKMDEDFKGALQYWSGRFDHWTFVHNSFDGVPPFVLQKLHEFTAQYPLIGFISWGFAELREKVRGLPSDLCVQLFGHAPSEPAMQSLRYSDVQEVLSHLVVTDSPDSSDLRPVPVEKLVFNDLSSEIQGFLRLGMRKSQLVADFFRSHPNPRYGDAMAYQFSEKYKKLKASELTPDMIFWDLRGFSGANDANSDKEQAAALAVLAHFFEECDIFERPPSPGGLTE